MPDNGTYVADSWRCQDCQCLNADHEAFCFRCGAGQPDDPPRIIVTQEIEAFAQRAQDLGDDARWDKGANELLEYE